MAANPYDQSGAGPPATKQGKNAMEPSGYTTRSPYGPAIPDIESLLGAARQTFGNLPKNGDRMSPVFGAMAGSNAADLSGFQGLLGKMGGQTNADKYLTGMAQNNDVDPYAAEVFGRSQDKLSNSINDRFSAAGRYASGDHARSLGDSLGGANAQFQSDQWNAAQQRKMAATGMLDAAHQTQLGMQGGILGNIANLQGSNYDRKLAAMGGQMGAQQFEQDAPWAGLKNWAGILGPIAGGFGSQTTYDTPTPLWEKLLGGGISLLGGLGGMFK